MVPSMNVTEADESGKVELCHKAGNSGNYVLIEVGAPAVDAHLENHGDGFPGEEVPGAEDLCFDMDCSLTACNITEIVNATMAPTDLGLNETDSEADDEDDGTFKVEVCHKAGNSGKYVLIDIAEPAVDAHLAHGDGFPGEEVPDTEGLCFDVDCAILDCMITDTNSTNTTMF